MSLTGSTPPPRPSSLRGTVNPTGAGLVVPPAPQRYDAEGRELPPRQLPKAPPKAPTTQQVANRNFLLGLVIGALLVGALTGWFLALTDHAYALPPCPTEDSVGCYWDADTMGNGLGADLVER